MMHLKLLTHRASRCELHQELQVKLSMGVCRAGTGYNLVIFVYVCVRACFFTPFDELYLFVWVL